MKTLLKYSLQLLFLGIGTLFICSTACKKEDPTIVLITVIDTAGTPVPGAEVHLRGNGTDTSVVVPDEELRFDDVRTTNNLGKASFDYSDLTMPGQAGFAVLDVTVTRNDHTGKAIVEVKENEINEATVRIRPQ